MMLLVAEEKIAKFSPQFKLTSLRLLGSGTDSHAYLANEACIFRFPKEVMAAQKSLAMEIDLLPRLHSSLPVCIPDFKHIAKEKDRFIYVGYPLLPGVPLEKTIFDKMDAHKQENTLIDLAAFLQSLHCFQTNIAKSCGVQEELYKGAYYPKQKYLLEQLQTLRKRYDNHIID